MNSASGYVNGLIQEDVLNGVTVDPSATYVFSIDLWEQNGGTDQSSATVTAALTVGIGSAGTDLANAVVGTTLQIGGSDAGGEIHSKGTPESIEISGADLLAAQNSGQVNIVFESVNDEAIVGFPGCAGGVCALDASQVSQFGIDDVQFQEFVASAIGDVNKDGVVDQADVDIAQLYLDGDGGDTAAVRQNTLGVHSALCENRQMAYTGG